MDRRIQHVSRGLWIATAAGAAIAMCVQDGMVAFGWERFGGPALAAAVMVALGIGCEGLVHWGARRWPWLRWTGPVLPVASAAIWGPGFAEMPHRPGPSPPAASGPDIVLVTLDTFRADHMGALCGPSDACVAGDDLTPALDAFAKVGTLFTQAVTTVPLTGPAHASMLTGLVPLEHGLTGNGSTLAAETVVPRLRATGRRTGAFIGSHVLDRSAGLERGFDQYDDRWGIGQRVRWSPVAGRLFKMGHSQRRGDHVVDRALQWLAAGERPAFLWVHLYDAHAPYRPPEGWWPSEVEMDMADRLDAQDDQAEFERGLDPKGEEPLGGLIRHMEQGEVHKKKLLYAASIRWTDHQAGRVFAALDPAAVVIVIGDHGESLDEHGYYFNHGARLYEPDTRVPFMVRWPGRFEGGTREDGLVAVTAVSRLLLEAAGLVPPGPPPREEEVALYTPGQQARRTALVRGGPHQRGKRQGAAVRLDHEKLVSHEGGAVAWFDLRADPGEAAPQPVPERLEDEARRVRSMVARAVRSGKKEQERLEALGYVE